MKTLRCSKCKQDLPTREFFKDASQPRGRSYSCKSCLKSKDRNSQYKRLYGITLEEYNELLESQDYSCAVCKTHKDEFADDFHKELAVDHCHKTGRVRGLLCPNCNRAIGLMKDNPERLITAAQYIQ